MASRAAVVAAEAAWHLTHSFSIHRADHWRAGLACLQRVGLGSAGCMGPWPCVHLFLGGIVIVTI